jgi:Uma2 family endonuclease
MGHAASRELLIGRWASLLADPSLQDVSYKIELNEEGAILMSPASNRHGMWQADIVFELRSVLKSGRVITECSVLTRIGVRVPDVAWASDSFLAAEADNTPFGRAPELCVEIRSPSNTDAAMRERIAAYLDAGALEVWIVQEDGQVVIHGRDGPREASQFGVACRLKP